MEPLKKADRMTDLQNISNISETVESVPGQSMDSLTGVVFDISRFSVNDGPGIRTLVFLKGCPLHCAWCANPESQRARPQLGFFRDKCASCMRCVSVCPYGEDFFKNKEINWEKCRQCMKCVSACPYGARYTIGERKTVAEVVDIVRRDMVFYRNSGGGMTLGGGEATMQPDFADAILTACQALGIHTALETCGFTPHDQFMKIAQHVDLLLFDLKHMDDSTHRKYTGGGNEIILKNIISASRIVPDVIIRYPMIPGFNDDPANIETMGRFIAEKLDHVRQVDILPYHSHGASKIERIGGQYQYDPDASVEPEKIEQARQILQSFGLNVSVGG